MGQGTPGVGEPEALEREIAGIRGTMAGLLRELDHRRHELLDWRLQVRRHAVVLIAGAAAVALLVAAARMRRRRPAGARREPSTVKKVFTAALAGAASVSARSAMNRLLDAARS